MGPDVFQRVRADRLGSGDERQPRVRQLALRLHLVTHARHHVGVRPDEDEVVVLARLDEIGILGQEAVAGMNGVTVSRLARGHDRRNVQIALGCAWRSNAHRAVREPRVQCARVRCRVHGDRFHAELVQRADDAHRDLSTVRHEHAREHR